MQFVEGMEQKKMNKRKTTILYLIITLLLTWLCQFMPIMMGMDVVFYLIITHTKLYKKALENVPEFEFLK